MPRIISWGCGSPFVLFGIICVLCFGGFRAPLCQEEALAAAEKLETQNLFREWRKHSAAVRPMFELSANFQGWSSRESVKLSGCPKTPRVIDVIDVAWGARLHGSEPQDTVKQLTSNFWCNTSQAVQRKPWSFDHGGALTPGATWYSFSKDTVLDGEGFLRIQGMPIDVDRAGLHDEELRDLGGNAYPAPLIGAAMLALYYQPWAPWWA